MPAEILSLVLSGELVPCYDDRIMTEYREVLMRPKFNFTAREVFGVLGQIEAVGLFVSPPPLSVPFADEDDRKFYEVAKYCGAVLITGNLRHFPEDEMVQSASAFLLKFPPLGA